MSGYFNFKSRSTATFFRDIETFSTKVMILMPTCIRGVFQERVERQGKGNQNAWNEPIDPCQKPWVQHCACSRENRFSKLKIFQNHPYLTLFWQRTSN